MKYYRKNNDVIVLPEEEAKPKGYHEITEEEYNHVLSILSQLAELKFELKKTDYKAIKHSEGLISEEDYAPIKEAREQLRVQIRGLEAELGE